jgi:hypothetical protein
MEKRWRSMRNERREEERKKEKENKRIDHL